VLGGAVPAFAPDGGLGLALLRALSVTALITGFGTLAFWVAVLPRVAGGAAAQARLLWLARLSLAGGLLLLGAWTVLVAGRMADAAGLGEALAAVPTVLTDTRFGHVIALQAGAAVLSLAMLGGGALLRRWLATGFAMAGVLLQAGHGHALAMADPPPLLLPASLLHLAGAGFWLGGVPALAMVVAALPPASGAAACRWFSPLGKICVTLVAASALVQGWVLVASLPGLVGTAYGWMVLCKALLFGALFGFALVNRYRLAPALRGERPAPARRVLLASLALQTGCGLLVVAAAAVLGGLAPAMHTQALWPFPWRVSLAAVRTDPGLAPEVLGAALALAAALALLTAAVRVRRPIRWLAASLAVGIAWLAQPYLAALLVPTIPTYYDRSPTGFSSDSIVAGAALYGAHCAACHDGAGRALAAAQLWARGDGTLFWQLSAGIPGPDGRAPVMPGFADTLDADDRWALIDYIRARDAGLSGAALRAPAFSATCDGGASRTLGDLRGGFVRVVLGRGAAVAGVTTVLAGAPGAQPAPGLCIAADETVAQAYAIVAGGDAAGTQFLIDRRGRLRALLPAADATRWNDPARLARELQRFAGHRLTAAASMKM
jgi:putative copper export protein/mono/diheme cytochrome c family protein